MSKRLYWSGRGSSRIPKGAVEIYSDIEEIKAQKGSESNWPRGFFKHKFTRKGGKIYGLPNGQLLIASKRPLWDAFEYHDDGGSMARRRHRRRGYGLFNPWRGHSAAHRVAALMRWGHLSKGSVFGRKRRRRRGRPKLRGAHIVRTLRRRHRKYRKHRKSVGGRHRMYRKTRKHRGRRRHYRRRVSSSYLDHRTRAYRMYRKGQEKEALGFLGLTHGSGKRFKFVHGRGWVKTRRNNPMKRYANRRRHYRRHRRNPDVATLGGYNWKRGIEPALIIGTSIMMSQVAVGYVASRGYIAFDSAWKRYGVQVGAGVAGVFALRAMKKPEWANYWGLGALVTVAADLLATYVLPSVNSWLAPASTTTTTQQGTQGFGRIGAYPNEVRGIGAFPSQVSRMQSPYDRSGSYPY